MVVDKNQSALNLSIFRPFKKAIETYFKLKISARNAMRYPDNRRRSYRPRS